jgi:hypothetical protein
MAEIIREHEKGLAISLVAIGVKSSPMWRSSKAWCRSSLPKILSMSTFETDEHLRAFLA